MTEAPSIQWFPGHMAKTRRLMRESIRLVDVVVELTDARIPFSSRNPELPRLVGEKPRIVLLNKCDAADPEVTRAWCEDYAARGVTAIATDCRSGKGLRQLDGAIRKVMAGELARRERRGMSGAPIRMMVVGIPNVGKSSFINRLAGSRRAKVEDRPGVTRGRQWVSLDNGMDLLDMPGILWPKFEDKTVGEHLAFTGAVKDDIMDLELLAMRLLELLNREYPVLLRERYRLTEEEAARPDAYELLQTVGRKRGMLMAGGVVNTERTAIAVLDEFRGGKIGRVSLEKPRPRQRTAGAAEK
ncbi:MAG: ribosome biogenesis GTPase YlqF [Oscillospiraceae bacterium]|nr:ribosome biogenesis GTPase YlqF [Oscillospiraceae bacterium]